MSVRFDAISVEWSADFEGIGHVCRIDLRHADQADPRLLALLDWWREREAEIAAARDVALSPADPPMGIM